MDAEYWHKKWADQQIGFHQSSPHEFLVAHSDRFNLGLADNVFVPLCGKTKDIGWLLQQGYAVSAIELNESAVECLFKDLDIEPVVTQKDELKLYAAERLQVYVGDIFALNSSMLPAINAIYDRAALVALPLDMRIRYTQHLMAITQAAQQLLITFDYDQSQMEGPPHSITGNEVRKHYSNAYDIAEVYSKPVANGLNESIEMHKHLRT